MKSLIHARDRVGNDQRKFGADTVYYPARLRGFGGARDALFTRHQLEVAVERAQLNAEDVPPRSTLERLADWLRSWSHR